MLTTCPGCGESDLEPVLEMEGVPVFCNVLWPSRSEALDAPSGEIHLAHCRRCNHFLNTAFDPGRLEYTSSYENSLHFSERFNQHARKLAQRLVSTYDLHGKDIVELGSGRGDFLRMICELGGNRGVGFDRSHQDEAHSFPDEASGQEQSVRFVSEFLTPEYPRLPVDFLCCRHVLEHVAQPMDFLVDLRTWLGGESEVVVYFEVPNALFTMEGGGIWDLIYEHPSFFTTESLVSIFLRTGFAPHSWGEAFGGQYLFILADVSGRRGETPELPALESKSLEASVAGFRRRFEAQVEGWSDRIAGATEKGTSLSLWGGGSKGVTFLNLVDPGAVIRNVVDINPRKHGMFVPGTGHEVVSPQALAEDPPDCVLVSNPIYVQEIEASLRELEVDAVVIPIQ